MIQALALSLILHASLAFESPLARTDDKNELSDQEIARLKKQRDLADTFMRRAIKLALKNVDVRLKNGKAGNTERAKDQASKQTLEKQLDSKRIFATGTTPAELTEFSRWLKQADKGKIKLTDQAILELVKSSAAQRLDDKAVKDLAAQVGKEQETSAAAVLQALAAEFRARIARDLTTKKRK